MFPVGSNFRRCQFQLKDLIRVSVKFDKDRTNSDIERCKDLVEKLYDPCIRETALCNMTVEMSNIIHLQHLMLVAGFNLLVNEDEEDKLDVDPIPFHPIFNNFCKGYAFETLEYIVRRLMYTDLLEDFKHLKDQPFLTYSEEGKMIDLQRETFDRILKELHSIARKRLSGRQETI